MSLLTEMEKSKLGLEVEKLVVDVLLAPIIKAASLTVTPTSPKTARVTRIIANRFPRFGTVAACKIVYRVFPRISRGDEMPPIVINVPAANTTMPMSHCIPAGDASPPDGI